MSFSVDEGLLEVDALRLAAGLVGLLQVEAVGLVRVLVNHLVLGAAEADQRVRVVGQGAHLRDH